MSRHIQQALLVVLAFMLFVSMARAFIGYDSSAGMVVFIFVLVAMMNSVRLHEKNKTKSYVYFSLSFALAVVSLVLFK